MNDIQLYINDQLVDLSDDSPIALTFQINNLAEVQNQQGNTSNQFKLPLTQRNRKVLGFPDDVAFCTNLPYTQYQAKFIQDGLEIIPYGIGELNGIDQDTASITILSGNVDFFDAIDGSLYDMGDSTSQWSNYGKTLVWKPYDHAWNLDSVVQSQTKTDGWIYPMVDYGNMTENFSDPVNILYLRPGFFIKTAIDLLVKSAGYKATGSLLSNPLYPLLIAQFSNGSWEHGADYQNQPDLLSCTASNSVAIQLNHPNDSNPGGRFIWDTATADPSHQLSGGLFTVAKRSDFTITVNLPHVYMYGKITGKHPTYLHVTITIHTPGEPDIYPASLDFTWDTGAWVRDPGTSGGSITGHINIYKQVLSCQTELAIGQSVEVNYTWFGDNPSSFTVFPGATFTVQAQNQTVKYTQIVQCERIFPDISQKDLLKDTLQRFGIICQTDNASRTISFNSFRDIVNNIPNAKNWTGKCLDQGKSIAFQLGGYAQVNNLKYKADDNVLPAGFADAIINVNDTTLAATADLFESQFAPTLNRPYLTGTISQIKMIDNTSDDTDFTIGVTPRILIDQKLDLRNTGKTVTFTDGSGNNRVVNDLISVPYFYKPDGDFNLCFGDKPGAIAGQSLKGLKSLYYPELEKILKQTKKVVHYFLLTPRDILELDLLIPIYLEQDSAYYYINKIDAWRKGQPTKVELVKL